MSARRRRLLTASTAIASALVAPMVFAATASAWEQPQPDETVDLSVTIENSTVPGALTLSVEAGSVNLAENGSTGLYRQFKGSLPTITVSDTRSPEENPNGPTWRLLGHASDFGEISAMNLGLNSQFWAPGDPDPVTVSQGSVRPGYPLEPGFDRDNVGLAFPVTLLDADSSPAMTGGTYYGGADLVLRTPVNQASGTYTSTFYLTLFE